MANRLNPTTDEDGSRLEINVLQERLTTSERRAPVTAASRIGTSQAVPPETSNNAPSWADVGQRSSRRWTLGRFTAATGFARISPSETACRSAEPRTLRTWAMVAAAARAVASGQGPLGRGPA